MDRVERIWVYLSATPLFWLSATLLAYEVGAWVFRRSGQRPLAKNQRAFRKLRQAIHHQKEPAPAQQQQRHQDETHQKNTAAEF